MNFSTGLAGKKPAPSDDEDKAMGLYYNADAPLSNQMSLSESVTCNMQASKKRKPAEESAGANVRKSPRPAQGAKFNSKGTGSDFKGRPRRSHENVSSLGRGRQANPVKTNVEFGPQLSGL